MMKPTRWDLNRGFDRRSWRLPRIRGAAMWGGWLLGGCLCLVAAPFETEFHFRQPDGTVIRLRGSGDEFQARFETSEGYTVIYDQKLQAYCYARLAVDGRLVSTGVPVHVETPERLGLPRSLRSPWHVEQRETVARRRQWEEVMEITERWEALKAWRRSLETFDMSAAAGAAPTVGVKVGLCLLIDFEDDPAMVPESEVEAFCNADTYQGFGNNGSVKQYFLDVSHGLLTYSNIVLSYIRIPNSIRPKSYYNDRSRDSGEQANELIRDAIKLLKTLPNYQSEIVPKLRSLTVDGQNRVVACNVLYAGENSGVWSKGLWPHAWALVRVGPQELWPGGPRIWFYQISNIGQRLELGTFVHENGHLLCGFPDLYDYDYDSKGGAGVFCLMGYGSFARNPVQVCAYLKQAAGWATVTDLTSSSQLLLTLTATNGPGFNRFYRYRKPGVSTEYYLFEARHQSGRDSLLPGSGVAIWHIDELGNRDDQRRNPNTRHQNFEVTLVQADNRWDLHRNVNPGDREDLYYAGNPATGYQNIFSDTSSPAARWWDGRPSGLKLHWFSAPGPVMECVIGDPDLAPRVTRPPEDQILREGTRAVLSVQAIGMGPITYQWSKDGNVLGHASGSELILDPVRITDAGRYRVRVSNRFGSTVSPEAMLIVIPALSLADAVDAPDWEWQTDGHMGWFGQTSITSDGADAASSGYLRHGQSSRIWTVLPGPGRLRFRWKVSSEPGADLLRFRVNAKDEAVISGEVDWTEKVVELKPGYQTVEWIYEKNEAVSVGQDCAWLDGVEFAMRPMAPVIVSQPISQALLKGMPVQLKVEAEGTPPLHYQWFHAGRAISAGTDAALEYSSMEEHLAGAYRVVISNRYGLAVSEPATLACSYLGVCGDNTWGQLQVPVGAVHIVSVAAGLWHTLALRSDGRVVAWGHNVSGQCDVPDSLTNAVAIAAGGYHSLAIRADGTVVGWGANNVGQARPPRPSERVVSVAAGHWHSLALTEEGRVIGWGDSSFGQLDMRIGGVEVRAIAAGARHGLALTRQGRVLAWGDNRNAHGQWVGQAVVPPGLSNVRSIAAGAYHSVAVLADGRVVAWGDNSHGQVTVPPGIADAVSVSAGVEHTLILRKDGSVIRLGSNLRGQTVLPDSPLSYIAAGGYHSAFLLDLDVQPRLVRWGRRGAGFCVWMQGWPRQEYLWEYQENLGALEWQVAAQVRGESGLMVLEDPGPLPPQRFYRVRVQP
ncbi:MAG: M6 family metalloprotease domain-containing protein [Verrucomicrobiota bacterium]|nr:M6 family metalloprotease domain-containing protein [Limisphaera sp.]MDW8381614.1 M6 family metalloprotease domain-containing protein [Verrucomicrobiota bacterium]